MKLYFLRHGAAEEHRPGLADGDRRLTPEGIEEMHAVAAGMKTLGLRFDALLTSPLARARETAVIVAGSLGGKERLRQEEWLECGCQLRDLTRALGGESRGAHILLVGHEPDFSEMISGLMGGGAVRMKKAALACVHVWELQPGGGELRWLLLPDHLRGLGAAP